MWLSSITNFEDDHHWRRTLACIKLDPTVAGDNALARDGGRPDVTGPALATGALKTTLSVRPCVQALCELDTSNCATIVVLGQHAPSLSGGAQTAQRPQAC